MSSNIATSSTPSYSAVLQQPSPLQKAPVGYFKSVPTNAPLVNPDGSFTLLNWRNTVSSLANKPFVGRVPPDCSSPNSLFLDRKANRISDKDILEVFAKDLLGTAFFPSEQFVQLTFKEADIYENTYTISPSLLRTELTIFLLLNIFLDHLLLYTYMVFQFFPNQLSAKPSMKLFPNIVMSKILHQFSLREQSLSLPNGMLLLFQFLINRFLFT